MKISLIEINQPIGVFYVGVMPARIVISVTEVKQREYDSNRLFTFGGYQRSESHSRIVEISQYCSDPDATFPTPIIIAISQNNGVRFKDNILEFNENEIIGEIIDGQHRISGIKQSGQVEKFDLPVIFMFDMTEEEKAYVFSIINSKQTKVPMSLIYDLFELSETRSPQKTCHEIARLLNSDEKSSFYRRLKMLGRKEDDLASLSQGSFVKYLLSTITKNPEQDMRDIKNNIKLKDDHSLPLRYYFIQNKDEVIYKIIFNLFGAISEVFKDEWNDPSQFILSKTTGYGAALLALQYLYSIGNHQKDLSREFFIKEFEKFKAHLQSRGLKLTSDFFPSNEQVQKKLADLVIESLSQ